MRSGLAAAALLLFVSVPAFAQIGGLGSASLPFRQEVSVAPPARHVHSARSHDVFLAGPDTYVPGRQRLPRFSTHRPFYGFAFYDDADLWTGRLKAAPTSEVEPGRTNEPKPSPARDHFSASDVASTPSVVGAGFSRPGPPLTFYVIPGCYAGDRPPVREELPVGCDFAKLRAVPARDLSR